MSNDDYSEEGFTTKGSGRRRPIRQPRVNSAETKELEDRKEEAKKRHAQALQDPTLLTKQAFKDRSDISLGTKRALTEVLGLHQMTEIQLHTYAAALGGGSVLGRSRTGTGKTLAYLLPAVERLLAADLAVFRPGYSIGVIVVAPTRELAMQIAEQAEALLTFHTDMDVACIYGGTKVQRDLRLLSGPRLPALLVATPGRFLELLDLKIGRRKFSDMTQETSILVLDEADRLLDGFDKETQKILSYLPRAEKRQTLLFSATISKRLRKFVEISLKDDVQEVDCLNDRSLRGETNLRVHQSYMTLPSLSDYVPTLLSIIQQHMNENKSYKILVFFPASKLVRFLVQFCNVGIGMSVLEIHSRMSQASRTRASNAFRSNKQAILFSSDVSARGVDYPDVSLVIQFGAPSTEDAYIHRLGRTGRAGQSGQGITVLMPFERNRMNLDMRNEAHVHIADFIERTKSAQLQIRSGHLILTPSAESACRAFLAYYIANARDIEPRQMLQHVNDFATGVGLAGVPRMDSKIIAKLGLEGLLQSL